MKKKISKPEKRIGTMYEGWKPSSIKDHTKIAYNQACADWEAYHNQEMRELSDDRQKLENVVLSLQDKVKELEAKTDNKKQEINDMRKERDEAVSFRDSWTNPMLRQKVKELEQQLENMADRMIELEAGVVRYKMPPETKRLSEKEIEKIAREWYIKMCASETEDEAGLHLKDLATAIYKGEK